VKFATEIEKLNQRVEQQAWERSGARLLMTHPGVGPITALATDVFLGDPSRFASSKELASYAGMIPGEHSSGKRQRLGGLTKQGNPSGPPDVTLDKKSREVVRFAPRPSGFCLEGYFLQESDTIARSVAVKWPCSFASESTVSLAFSFAPCMAAFDTLPEIVTVWPTCPASFTVLD